MTPVTTVAAVVSQVEANGNETIVTAAVTTHPTTVKEVETVAEVVEPPVSSEMQN